MEGLALSIELFSAEGAVVESFAPFPQAMAMEDVLAF